MDDQSQVTDPEDEPVPQRLAVTMMGSVVLLFLIFRSAAPTWSIALFGVAALLLAARILGKKFAPKRAALLVKTVGWRIVFLLVPVFVALALVFLIKRALGLGSPSTREIVFGLSLLGFAAGMMLFGDVPDDE